LYARTDKVSPRRVRIQNCCGVLIDNRGSNTRAKMRKTVKAGAMPRSNEPRIPKASGPPGIPLSSFLAPLTHEDLLAEAGGSVRTMAVHKNKDVLIAGNHYESVYVNHDGWLSRYKILHNGSRQIIDFILPGQIFGLQACLFQKSLYSVAAITETALSAIPFEMIDKVFEQSPRLGKALFWSATCEAAIVAEHLIDAARRSAYERISHLLLELFVRLKGAGLADGMSFDMPLTQELIGDALGLTTVHVNRTIRSLREDKLIAIEGKVVTILDFEGLSLLSDFENSYLAATARALGNAMNQPKPEGSSKRKRAAQVGST
jgi:CRP-like cAMP-binding protein